MFNKRYWAVVMLLITVSSWGGMYHVAKDTLLAMDAFWLTVVRCSLTALIFLPLLIWREGLQAIRLKQHFAATWWYGTIGFAGFNYFVFMGLGYSRPEHGALIMATMPLITAIVSWISERKRPPGYTLISIVIALFGVTLVLTRGDFKMLWHSNSSYGDFLFLMGAIVWVLYTRSAVHFEGWSSFRFTVMTSVTGAISSLIITGILTLLGIALFPQLTLLPELMWNIIYIVGLATIIAVWFWNQGIQLLGAINGMLFINLVPVSAYIIGIMLGHAPHLNELIGVALILVALVTNNLLTRRQLQNT